MDDKSLAASTPEQFKAAQDPRRISPDVKVTAGLATLKTKFEPLEPVRLEASVRNISKDHEVSSRFHGEKPEGDYRIFLIKVFHSNGELVPETRFAEDDLPWRGLPAGGGLGLHFRLVPEDFYHCTLTANLVRDMTSPDLYTILVEFPTGEWTEIDGKLVELVGQSEPITVEVLSRSPNIWTRPSREKLDRFRKSQEESREKLARKRREEEKRLKPQEGQVDDARKVE